MRYQLLFRLACKHAYYPGDLCTGLAWNPAPSVLAAYRMQWRPTPDGGGLWIPIKTGNTPLIPLAAGDVITFGGNPVDAGWHSFSEGPAPGKQWLFSNRTLSAAQNELSRSEQLNTGSWVSAEIVNNASLTPGKVFTLTMRPQPVVWRYYLIYNGQAFSDPSKFAIEDGSSESPVLSFPAAGRRLLSPQDPDPADTFGTRLLAQTAGKNLLRLTAAAAIDARQKVRKPIRLKYDNAVLIPQLVNPTPADRGIKIIYL